MPQSTLIFLIVLACAGFLVYVFFLFKTRRKRREKRKRRAVREKIVNLSKSRTELTPEEFFKFRSRGFGIGGTPRYADEINFEGVYVLYNRTKNKYYVGQGHRIADRVNMHFTGKGNGDVYADYKYGDKFTVKMIALKHSGFRSLNALERETIGYYKAYAEGYNKTKGNKN